jgi:hypothetical protein
VLFVLALVFGAPLPAQEEPGKKKPAVKKQAAAKKASVKARAHAKPTPEQIRKFNELQKKQ